MAFVWLGALIVFAVIEAVTINLVSIWFAVGSLAALISALCGAGIWLQAVLFVVVSAVVLFAVRPLAKKYLNPKRRATNADRVLNMTGVVTEEINNLSAVGTVSVGGKLWSARSSSGEAIPAGTIVQPIRIEGVKLIVEPSAAAAAEHK